MTLSGKDAAGLALVAGACLLVLLHDGGSHRQTHLPPSGEERAQPIPGSGTSVAFVDFAILSSEGEDPLPGQVVVVRDGVIDRVGAVGVVEPPDGVVIVTGGATSFIVPGRVEADGPDAVVRYGRLSAGTRAELVVVDADPRHDRTALHTPRGVMVRGTWHDRRSLDRTISRPAGRP